MLALHGGGGYGNDELKQTHVGHAMAIRRNIECSQAIVIFPQAMAVGRNTEILNANHNA